MASLRGPDPLVTQVCRDVAGTKERHEQMGFGVAEPDAVDGGVGSRN